MSVSALPTQDNPCCDKTSAAAFILVFTVGLLYAGDKLVEVNGVPVEGLEPEQVINILVLNLFSTLYLKSNCMLFLFFSPPHMRARSLSSLNFFTENSDCFLTVDKFTTAHEMRMYETRIKSNPCSGQKLT